MRVEVSRNDRFVLASTSKGNQLKWFQDDRYYKADTMGYESISEVLASTFFQYVSDIDFIPYSFCEIHEEGVCYEGCYSENCLAEDESMISFYRLFQYLYSDVDRQIRTYTGADLVRFTGDAIDQVTGLDCMEYLGVLVYLDCMIWNEDRHFNNISVIYSATGGYRFSPVFDSGLSFFSDLRDYPLDLRLSDCAKKIRSKPFASRFEKQVRYFDRKPLVIDFDGFCSKLEAFAVPFKEREFFRAKSALLLRLRQTEGQIWIRK